MATPNDYIPADGDGSSFYGGTPTGRPSDPGGFYNPGALDPHAINPFAGAILDQYRGIAGQANPLLSSYLNPTGWNQRVTGMQAGAAGHAAAGYAGIGMAGSPVAQGGAHQAATDMGYAELMRQPQLQSQALRLNGMIEHPMDQLTLQTQGQYGGYQNQLLEYQLAEQGMNAQMLGQMFQGIGSMGGMAMGGMAKGYGAPPGGGLAGMDPSGLDSEMTGSMDPSGGYNFGDWSSYGP